MGTRSTAPADIMGAVPTIPVLERTAAALGAELILTIAPPAAEPTLRPKMPRAEEAGGHGNACNGLCNETVGIREDSRYPEGLDVAIGVYCGP